MITEEIKKKYVHVTSTQCNDKWQYLKDKYTKKKDNMGDKSSSAARIKFDFCEELEEFLDRNITSNL
jgi:hypothetical protein